MFLKPERLTQIDEALKTEQQLQENPTMNYFYLELVFNLLLYIFCIQCTYFHGIQILVISVMTKYPQVLNINLSPTETISSQSFICALHGFLNIPLDLQS